SKLLNYFNIYTLLLLFNFWNFIVYGVIAAASILTIIGQIENVIIFNGISCAFSLLLLINEIYTDPLIVHYFRFLSTFRGRGLCYILFSLIIYQKSNEMNVIACYFVASSGLCYIILSFIPQLLSPNDIRGNWKAYRQYLDELYLSYYGSSNMSQNRIKNYQQASTIR
ncbi:hypothetical protein K502DRAFT_284394, partial [Neoconidiobolus thromboides FSU 785]